MNRAEKRAQEKAQKQQEKAMLSTAAGCNQLAVRLMATEPNRSYELLTRAITMEPSEDAFWVNYMDVLQRVKLSAAPAHILQLLNKRLTEPSQIAIVFLNIGMFFLVLDKKIRDWTKLPEAEILNHPVKHELLFNLLESHIIASPPLEHWLVRVRNALLLAELDEEQQEQWKPFLKVLARLCFRNEYVFWQSDEETVKLETLDLKNEWQFLLAACYSPVDRQDQLMRERELAASISPSDAITDEVSQKVKAQYEENPYPRWEKIQLPKARPVADELQRVMPLQPSAVFAGITNPPQVLIAGCGTGQHAVQVASRYKDSQVLGVDLSAASLGYAKSKIEEYGFADKVELKQADILSLDSLNQTFDIIESAGVLHHMEDPIAGWKVLKSLLKPEGVMKIALYSDPARQFVVQAREWIAQNGYESTPQGIRQCRRDIMLSPGVAQWNALVRRSDFYSMSDCRDLIFHVQEHRYTIPKLEEILDELGFEFLGFEHDNNAREKLYAQHYPHDRKQTHLNNWHQLEKKDFNMFAGMYQMWMRLKP
ncbi:MAG: class I SAM-dependent methyltransferase [Rickettsiales bacterium]|nr:class I SAM-dependent methyltransferase [Rickettsiales bacterium]